MLSETVELRTPVGRDWRAVARLVLGGIGERLDLGIDELDDLQLAVERLLAEAGAQESVHLSFELSDRGVRAHVGPLAESTLAEALQGPEPPPGQLTLRRILATVVDSFGVDHVEDEGLYVRLEKIVRPTT
ncbi:MAG TPA: hypothetical protein VGR10_02505 [Thermoleophilaceae bacterium]|nr:hypothetical protein [Thermoleophilaceae bacterium]